MMKIKQLYHDMRIGQTVIFPILSMINFIIISYKLLELDFIQLEFYIPLVIGTVIFALVIIGYFFRHKQQPTDARLNYEKNIEHVRTMLAILESQENKTPAVLERISYHKRILDNNS